MTSKLAKSVVDLSAVRPQAGAGRFILTLCTLDAPVAIRQSQSPQLQPFTFFMSRACQSDGSERLYLNMGYFNTLADAQRWAAIMGRQFPSAFATVAPGALPYPAAAQAPSPPRAAGHAAAAAATDADSLSDSQVLRILEARHEPTGAGEAREGALRQIELLRPDDTVTRRVLKEAVARDAPVWFAVQLQWSAQPIDLGAVRPLAAFRAHTLYATESRRNGRSRYFLRLGFFADPASAKQLAVEVRSAFDSAAVVPVVEPEITRAREAGKATAAIPYLAEPRVEEPAPDAAAAVTRPAPASNATRRALVAAATAKHTAAVRAGTQMWTETDLLSESGVRHLRVERQENLSGRWRTIQLSDESAREMQV